MLVSFWIQTVLHPDSVPDFFFFKKLILNKVSRRKQKHEKLPSMQRVKYSKTCVKRPLSKRPQIGFQDQLSLNAGQEYCRMLQGEHSATLLTFIKLPFVIKSFVLSIFEWPFYTGPRSVVGNNASLTADPGIASSILGWSLTFVEIDHQIISTVILLPSAESFMKGCCQLQAKVCARSTG